MSRLAELREKYPIPLDPRPFTYVIRYGYDESITRLDGYRFEMQTGLDNERGYGATSSIEFAPRSEYQQQRSYYE
jgi:hypothetical protein